MYNNNIFKKKLIDLIKKSCYPNTRELDHPALLRLEGVYQDADTIVQVYSSIHINNINYNSSF